MPGQLVARDLHFNHGPEVVLAGVSLTVAPGDRIGIVGANGVGKSTLLRLLAGRVQPASGRVVRHPATLTVDLLDQEPRSRAGETVAGMLRRRVGLDAADAELSAAAAGIAAGEPGADERYAAALDRYLRLDVADAEARINRALTDVGLPERIAAQEVATLSGGQATKAGLAAVALARGDVLLLDEPTNNLDGDGLALLESLVASTPAGVVLVSHDRAFLESTVGAVVEIDDHDRTARRFDGGWAAYLRERATARRHAEEAYATYDGRRRQLLRRAQREREWATEGVRRARKDRSERDKFIRHFRVASSEQLAARARRTEMTLERMEPVERPWEGWELRLSFAATERGGDLVASLDGAVVERGGFGLGPVDLSVGWGERLAIAGANGSGKTTLVDALVGDLPLAAGAQRLGSGVVPGRLDQARRRFGGAGNVADTVLSSFMAETGVDLPTARSALAKLGLDAAKLNRPAVQLSPGERTRAVLAAFATRGVNLLVLDEPTNHLDLPAIEQLEAALDRFGGTVVVVTHDRAFAGALRLSRRVELDAGRVVADDPL